MDLRGLGSMVAAMRGGAGGIGGAAGAAGGAAAGAAGAASSLGGLRGAAGVAGAQGAGGVAPVGAGGFGSALADALESVSATQTESAELQRRYAAGDGAVSLEQTMLAMQKSQIAFQAATTVRNRLVSAYTDIMNMNV